MKNLSLRFSLLLALLAAAGCGKDEPGGTVIGPAGGTVTGPDGVSLVIPAGALVTPTEITITRAAGVADNFHAVSPAFRFEPEGLAFQQPAVLVIPFPALLVQGAVADVAIWWGTSPTTRWAPLASQVNPTLGTVSAEITHFSYGAAGEVDPACVPECTGRTCGIDGCGGTCAPGCPDPELPCVEATGTCLCIPDCTDRECGNDGCGGTCAPGCGAGTCLEALGRCFTCGNGTCELGETTTTCPDDCQPTTKVDLLIVVDDSGSMAEEQALLQAQFEAMLVTLTAALGQAPDLHVGVTSTDLGTGAFPITYCEEPGGDAGRLLKGTCAYPEGVSWIVDAEPALGCTVERNLDGTCAAHNCIAANCIHEGSTTFVVDADGCPRCRNTGPQTTAEAFSCIAGLGTTGCGFEQQLEAMYLALDQNPSNTGFLRDDAVLAILFVTDEDDCSASNPQIFDNTQVLIDSPLGPLTSFRCFEFGVTCNVNDRTTLGERTDCVPRDDAGALLHPIRRYTDFLTSLRDPGRIVVAAIAGPADGNSVTVGLDEYQQPDLQKSCVAASGAAAPGIRMSAFVNRVTAPDEQSGAYASICQSSFTTALESLGARIAARMK